MQEFTILKSRPILYKRSVTVLWHVVVDRAGLWSVEAARLYSVFDGEVPYSTHSLSSSLCESLSVLTAGLLLTGEPH